MFLSNNTDHGLKQIISLRFIHPKLILERKKNRVYKSALFISLEKSKENAFLFV